MSDAKNAMDHIAAAAYMLVYTIINRVPDNGTRAKAISGVFEASITAIAALSEPAGKKVSQ